MSPAAGGMVSGSGCRGLSFIQPDGNLGSPVPGSCRQTGSRDLGHPAVNQHPGIRAAPLGYAAWGALLREISPPALLSPKERNQAHKYSLCLDPTLL